MRPKRRRPLPPGQRLLVVFLIAGILAAGVWSMVSSSSSYSVGTQPQTEIAQLTGVQTFAPPTPFPLREELKEFELLVQMKAKQPNLQTGVFMVEPSTGRYAELNAKRAYPAASMIKLPIFVKLLAALESGQVQLTQNLTIRKDLIGGGSGWLQWRAPGTKVSLKDTAELMMTISDNTATNMIIDVLGGKDVCNRDFAAWGLKNTQISNLLPDLGGTNTTSPYDLAFLLGKVDHDEMLTPDMKNYMFSVLLRNKHNSLLPLGVPPGTLIAHKTGDIGMLVGDAGLITTKAGQRYIIVAQVQRPHNDRRANLLIRQISKEAYVAFTGDAESVKDLLKPAPPAAHKSRHRAKSHTGHRRRSRRHR